MQYGTTLKERRLELNLTQAEVSKKTKLSQTSISQIESGKKQPSPSTVKKLCKLYKLPTAVFVWRSIETNDIPKSKLHIYDRALPIVNELIDELMK
jgi:transcriptional regulator with XRE-family HTH domain